MPRKSTPLFVFLLIAGTVSAVAFYVHAHWAQMAILNPAGPIARDEMLVMVLTVLLCSIVVIPVFVMLFVFGWKYRADNKKNEAHYSPEGDLTRGGEVGIWIVPIVIIIILGVLAWHSSHVLDPYVPIPGKELNIEVVALDWKWLFIYPDQKIASVNYLEIPEGVPVHFHLTADAPMNSFWIPQLGGQIMVMPGMASQLSLLASRTGSFNGFSANISGEGFSGMAFETKSVSQSDFNAWVIKVAKSNNPLTSDGYTSLAATSTYNMPVEYSSVPENLYTSIIGKYMAPAGSHAMDMPMDMQ